MNTNVIVHLLMMWPTINEPSRRRLYVKNECRRPDERAQKGLMVKGAKIFVVDIFTEEDNLGIKHKLVSLGSGGSNRVPRICSDLYLPVNDKSQKLL